MRPSNHLSTRVSETETFPEGTHFSAFMRAACSAVYGCESTRCCRAALSARTAATCSWRAAASAAQRSAFCRLASRLACVRHVNHTSALALTAAARYTVHMPHCQRAALLTS